MLSLKLPLGAPDPHKRPTIPAGFSGWHPQTTTQRSTRLRLAEELQLLA
jgi:hypothetical protein